MKKFRLGLILAYFMSISFFYISCNFTAGSYPYAEKYLIKTDENSLISSIIDFKKNNPKYNIPNSTRLIDGRSPSKDDYWYHIYFYYPEENQIVYTWIRNENKNETAFALIGINQGLELGKWRTINKDFSRSENAEQKKKFEDRILKKVKEILQLKRISVVPN